MTTRTTTSAAAATRSRWPLAAGPAHQALLLLRTVFTIAPIVFGLDKFFNLLTDWPNYLAPWVDGIVPGTAQQAMYVVGIIEIVAGVFVALKPRWGSLVVVLWLAGIIVNLLILGDFYDVALRDFGLLIGALALSRLALLPRPESSASSS